MDALLNVLAGLLLCALAGVFLEYLHKLVLRAAAVRASERPPAGRFAARRRRLAARRKAAKPDDRQQARDEAEAASTRRRLMRLLERGVALRMALAEAGPLERGLTIGPHMTRAADVDAWEAEVERTLARRPLAQVAFRYEPRPISPLSTALAGRRDDPLENRLTRRLRQLESIILDID